MKTISLVLYSAGFLFVLVPNVFSQADIQVDSITTSPVTISAGVAPDQVTLLLDNLGPDSLPIFPYNDSVVIEYRFSSDTDPIGTNAIILTNVAASIDGGLPPGSYEFDYDPLSCSDLVIPPSFKGTNGYYFVYVTPYMDTDPNVANNLIMSGPVTVLPVTSSNYQFFTQPVPITLGFQMVSNNSFSYNSTYGNSWIFNSLNSGFTDQFTMSNPGTVRLHVRHLSSLSSSCSGQGYSPVSIFCNGVPVVTNYDPALNHGGVHTFVDDFWTINVQAGTNTLQWQANQLCSRYWIQMLEILPASVSFTSINFVRPNVVTFGIQGTTTNVSHLESSTNLVDWKSSLSVPAFTNACSVSLTNVVTPDRQFFRLNVPQ
jgi:hypothetical protein